jgi:hypothetical protein
MAPRIIALYSPVMQSGKTTAAQHLSGLGYVSVHFADPIKAMVDTLLTYVGLHQDDIYDRLWGDKKELQIPEIGGTTARRLMQTLGSEWGRGEVNQYLWVDILARRLKRESETKFVIDDLRFRNEFHAIRSIPNAEVWLVNRPDLQATNSHPSEGNLGMVSFDRVITNDGDIASLHAKINEAMWCNKN